MPSQYWVVWFECRQPANKGYWWHGVAVEGLTDEMIVAAERVAAKCLDPDSPMESHEKPLDESQLVEWLRLKSRKSKCYILAGETVVISEPPARPVCEAAALSPDEDDCRRALLGLESGGCLVMAVRLVAALAVPVALYHAFA